jgi:hypothetical protein
MALFPQILSLSEAFGLNIQMFDETLEALFDHLPEEGGLENEEFYAPVFASLPDPRFFSVLPIATVFPQCRFYAARARREADGSLVLMQISEARVRGDFFLMVRTQPTAPDSDWGPYYERELSALEKLKDQEHDFRLIGFATLVERSIVAFVFLTTSLTTLESHLAKHSDEHVQRRLARSGRLISLVCQAHSDDQASDPPSPSVCGFDIRPCTVLVTSGATDLGVALCCYVGDKASLDLHPNGKEVRWNKEQSPPELRPKVVRRPQVPPPPPPPTSMSDVYGVGFTLHSMWAGSAVFEPVLMGLLVPTAGNRKSAPEVWKIFCEHRDRILLAAPLPSVAFPGSVPSTDS